MTASHHDREEETLISYFQQMLAEVDDQEFEGEIQATSGDLSTPAPAPQADNQAVLAAANAAIAQSHAVAPAPAPVAPVAPVQLAQAQVAPAQVARVAPAPALEPEPETVDSDNPFAGMPRLSTQEMLAQEMVMVEEPDEAPEVAPVAAPVSEPVVAPVAEPVVAVAAEPVAPVAEPPAAVMVEPESQAYEPEYEPRESSDYAQTPYEPIPEPMVQTELEEQHSREFALPDDQLQRLLEKIDTSDPAVQTQVALAAKIAQAAPQVATKVAEPEVAVAEPEVAVAEPEVATEVAVAEPEVATEVAVAEPEVAVATPVVEPQVAVAPVVTQVKQKQKVLTPQELAQERMRAKLQAISANWKNVDLGQQFQVLFFLVQGVRFAVPLIDLGGIFECDKITQLFGKPSWFMGITDVRGTKINIVDTLRWVMPEIGDSPDKYPYLISLGKSQWSIGCDVLEGNRTLTSNQIKWREIPGNRPWLAGIVTSEKCALLHVSALIALFEAGADIDDLNREAQAEHKEKRKQH